MKKRSHTLVLLIMSALFAALMVVSAFIRIPTPIVAITFQIQVALLSGILLGSGAGAASMAVYIMLGLAGLPVFAQGGGLSYVLKPSFGYVAAFLPGSFLAGVLTRLRIKNEFLRLLTAFLSGSALIYLVGTAYCVILMKVYIGSTDSVFLLIISCAGLPLIKDLLLCVPFTLLAKRLIPVTNRLLK